MEKLNNRKNRLLSSSLHKILQGVLSYRLKMVGVIIAVIISTVVIVIGPRELGKATTVLFEGISHMVRGTGGIDYESIGRILLRVLSLYIIGDTFGVIQGYLMSEISQDYTFEIRTQMMEKVSRLPMSYFESQPLGETLSRIVNDVDTLGASLAQGASEFITSIATMIGIAIVMFSMSIPMALTVMIIVPVSFFIIKFISQRSQRFFRNQQVTLGKLTSQIEESYGGLQLVKAFNHQEKTQESFEIENAHLWEDSWKAQFFSGMMYPLMRFVASMGYVAVVILGAFLTMSGTMTVGEIQAFTQYVNRFSSPITQISQIMNLFQQMAAAGDRVYEFLELEEESQTEGRPLEVDEVEGLVSFNEVNFGYVPDKIIVNDFTASVQPGEKVALVGPTGAGKSTIVKLLMRFYDVNKGNITLDHKDTKQYSRQSYQQAMAMVLQDTWLFKGSLMENIRYGRLEATDEEVIQAAKEARVHHFIQSLPGGYDFQLNEETDNISQGQKQLLTIARAILADRPILILDEATSSVDTRTEVLIQEAMDELMKGRTSFVIAHRLSTIKDADTIFYMEDGDIVEQGNHETLMHLNGQYAKLYNSQFDAV